MGNRSKRALLAKASLQIMEQGYYKNQEGVTVSIEAAMNFAKTNSKHYLPTDFNAVFEKRDKILKTKNWETVFEVHNQTTFAGVRQLIGEGNEDVVCLNFASAKNPGGGFLGGSQAQEEALARASGMYACLRLFKEHYEYHRKNLNCLYSDRMIYSPKVPVFRDDKDALLDVPYTTSIITSPAVNAGCVKNNYPQHLKHITATMIARTEKVLSLAVLHQHDTIVLGAWGCGVFRNNPADMAHWFAMFLKEGIFKNAFKKVIFSVLDRSKERKFVKPFEKEFNHNTK